jgi:hypothetical protein
MQVLKVDLPKHGICSISPKFLRAGFILLKLIADTYQSNFNLDGGNHMEIVVYLPAPVDVEIFARLIGFVPFK